MSTHRRLAELTPGDWIALATGLAALLVVGVLSRPPSADWPHIALPLLAWIALTAFASVLGFKTSFDYIGLDNLFIVGAFLAFRLSPALWVAAISVVVAEANRTIWADRLYLPRRSIRDTVISTSTHLTLQVFSLLAGSLVYALAGGQVPLLDLGNNLLPLLGLFTTHWVAHRLFATGFLRIQGQSVREYFRREYSRHNRHLLVPFELALLPFAAVIALTFTRLDGWAFGALWLSLSAALVVFYWIARVRGEMERQLKQQVALNAIGAATRASLDLPELLHAIYTQLSQLLDARNMYIALYDAGGEQLTFPIYSEGGELRKVKPHSAGHSAALHVIRTRQPLLIHEEAAGTLAQMGLELPETGAVSWLGIPIASSDRVLGVMVLYSAMPHAYTQNHVEMMNTIAAQAALAIGNAQMYSTMRQRATELAIINAVSSAVSSTLDLTRVLDIITSSIMPVVGCQKSAIFLANEAGDELALVKSQGLSPAYVKQAQHIKIALDGRGMAAAQRKPLVVPDVTAAGSMEFFALLGSTESYRAFAELPLIAQNTVIGTLAVYFAAAHPFTQSELDILQTFANQAASAVNNARLYARTDQTLARRVQELSVLEEIGRELAGTLDTARISDLIVERTLQVTGAQLGLIVLLDEKGLQGRVITYRHYAPSLIEPFITHPWPPHQGIAGRVMRTGQLADVPDVQQDPDHWPADANVRSLLAMPILREGRVLGVINLESYRLAGFDKGAVSLTQQVANQAAIAIENASLFNERARRINALSQLHQASLALTSSLDLQQVLNRLATAAHALTDADTINLLLYDGPTDTFSSGANAGLNLPGSSVVGVRSYGMTRRAVKERRPILCGDTRAEPDANPRLVAAGVRSLILLPIVSREIVLGILNAYSFQPLKFTDADVQIMSALANQAAAALENARLFQAAADARDKLGAILMSSHEGILMLDLAGRVVMANSAIEFLLGIPRSDIEGRLLGDLLDKPGLDIAAQLGYSIAALIALVDQLREGRKLRETHDSYRLTRPAERFVERTGMPVLDAAGGLFGWMIIVRDVTQERELQRIRDDLTNMIIHDLRSPLSAILSGLYLLREVLPPSDPIASDAISASEQSCRKLLDLVNSLLDISKMEAGRMELVCKPTNLSQVIALTLDRLAPLAQEHRITMRSHIQEGSIVFAEEDKIGRVLTNLIDNALKFTPVGGQITVTAEPMPGREGFVRCGVQDTGPGVPAEYSDRIFDRFAQSPGSKGRRRGTGLGLTFCKLVVEAHGGHIWVKSQEGKGSTFYFTLPISNEALM